jgi:cell division protein FtsZ
VSEAAHSEANIIFGTVIDDTLGDEVRVTVIAAGFDGGLPKAREAAPAEVRIPETETVAVRPAQRSVGAMAQPVGSGTPLEPQRTPFDDVEDDGIDIPDFLK